MENKLFTCYRALIALTVLILGTSAAFAAVPTVTLESASDVATLFTGATTGPPPSATFPDNTPTVPSDTPVALNIGPAGAPTADSVLLVLSATNTNVNTLGSITLSFDSATGSPVTFTSGNFFTTAGGSIPSGIMGIANGSVNGIKFYGDATTTVLHAAADITFPTAFTPSPSNTGTLLGDVTITSPIPLRVDVFSDLNGKIINSAANSGALGVVPEPNPMALYGVGAIGLIGVMVLRHRRHHCTSA